MSDIHAGPVRAHIPGNCCWTHHFEDCDLRCDEHAIPGSRLCAEHTIAREAIRADKRAALRRFPARTVTLDEEVTG